MWSVCVCVDLMTCQGNDFDVSQILFLNLLLALSPVQSAVNSRRILFPSIRSLTRDEYMLNRVDKQSQACANMYNSEQTHITLLQVSC